MYDYIKHIRWAQLKVGIVITLALAAVFMAIMFAGSIEEFFAPRVHIHAVFDDVKGLRAGSPVWFSGVEIGAVTEIEFTMERTIRVGMAILADTLKYLKKDSHADILTLGLLGDKYIEITPGTKESPPLNADDTLIGVSHIEIKDIVETGRESIAKIADFMEVFEKIIVKIESGEGTVSKFLNDPSVHDNLKKTTHELSQLIKNMKSGKGSVGKLMTEDVLYRNISTAVSDVKLFAKTMQQSEGTIHKLIEDPALYNRFQKASESLDIFAQKLTSSKGTVNKLLEDESLYNNINDVSLKVNGLLEKVDRGEGLMGSLVSDDEISVELKNTLKELNLLIEDIKKNPKRYFKFSIF